MNGRSLSEVVSGKVPLAMPAIGEDGEAKKYPSMPCVTSERIQHREKAAKVVRFFDALVSRPVGRKEMLTNPDALASMKKEWSGLIDQGVFDLGAVREYDAVAKEAKAKGEEIHMARAHGICVEKHSQLPVGDPKRKFKGRGVLLGNQVKNQSFEAAMFQDLGNSPASFEASRWADFLGCHDGWDVQMADAIQAYIQATLRGTPCWIELPPEAVPSECKWDKYRRPVVPLRKALYGHPDAGTFWEQHCDESVRSRSPSSGCCRTTPTSSSTTRTWRLPSADKRGEELQPSVRRRGVVDSMTVRSAEGRETLLKLALPAPQGSGNAAGRLTRRGRPAAVRQLDDFLGPPRPRTLPVKKTGF